MQWDISATLTQTTPFAKSVDMFLIPPLRQTEYADETTPNDESRDNNYYDAFHIVLFVCKDNTRMDVLQRFKSMKCKQRIDLNRYFSYKSIKCK